MTLKETKPVRGYLLVEPEVSETKKSAERSGIVLADIVKTTDIPQTGVVLKVGTDMLTEQGAVLPSPVVEGAKVIYKKWGGNEIKIEDKSYYFVRFDDILGVC